MLTDKELEAPLEHALDVANKEQKKTRELPIGIDEWIKQGEKYKYFDYLNEKI